MDDNVMRVLEMLQEGKISPQEAETLIAALRGEAAPAASATPEETPAETTETTTETDKPAEAKPDDGFGFKLDLDDLGDRISKAVSKIQPEQIVKRVQAQLRTATQAGASWGANVSSRVRTWAEGDDRRPQNHGNLSDVVETHQQEFHLDGGASVLVENAFGNITVKGLESGPARVVVTKTVWAAREEDLKATAEKLEIHIHGTDTRLDIKVSAPDFFREGTVDLELHIPANVAQARASARYGNVEMSALAGRAEAVTTSGNLHLLDLHGDARGETVSGDMKIERIGGKVTVATQSGDIHALSIHKGLSANAASGDVSATEIEGGRIEAKSVSGDVQVTKAGLSEPVDLIVESVSGDATLKEASGNISIKAVSGDATAEQIVTGRLQAQTVSGNVNLSLREPFAGTMHINTVSGDVEITLPDGSNARVSLGTASGDLTCEHEATDVNASETLWTGRIGNGDGTLNVQTISGDATLKRVTATDTPPPPPAEPEPPIAPVAPEPSSEPPAPPIEFTPQSSENFSQQD